MSRVDRHLDFFKFLSKLEKKQRTLLIKNLTDDQVAAVAELALNLLAATFRLSPRDKKLLSSKKSVIRKLGTRGSSARDRRKLITSNASTVSALLQASVKVLK